MHSRLGIFFVTGNHEYYYGNVEEWISLFISYGITTLRNTFVIFAMIPCCILLRCLFRITHLGGLCVVGLDDISSEWSGYFCCFLIGCHLLDAILIFIFGVVLACWYEINCKKEEVIGSLSLNSCRIIGHAMNVSAIEACEIGAPVVVLAHNPASVAQIVEFSRNTGHPVHLILSGIQNSQNRHFCGLYGEAYFSRSYPRSAIHDDGAVYILVPTVLLRQL